MSTTTPNLGLSQPQMTDQVNQTIPQLANDLAIIDTSVGNLSNLATTNKTSLVAAINENASLIGTENTSIGTLSNLLTTDKSNLVNAINEDTNKINQISVNVKDPRFGAKGDGVTNDTAAIQAAIDSITSGTVFFPPGTYNIGGGNDGGIFISNKTNYKLVGYGAIFNITQLGSSGSQGIKMYNTLTNVTIEGLTIIGSGNVNDNHVGIYSSFGNIIANNLRILNCRVLNTTIGIDVNGNQGTQTGGNINDVLIQGNHLENIVGVNPGYGYGIHVSDQVGTWSNIKIIGNTIIKAQRHSIYYSQGGGGVIEGNVIRDHRLGVNGQGTGGNTKAAIDISRSQGVSVVGNIIHNFWDSGIMVWGDTSGKDCKHVTITGNTLHQSNSTAAIVIGSSSPSTESTPVNIVISSNIILTDTTAATVTNNTDGISIYSCLRLKIIGNNIALLNSRSGPVAGVHIYGFGESSGTATYSDDIDITDNTIYGTNGTGGFTYGFNLENAPCISNMKMRFRNNALNVPNSTFDIFVALSNPNVELTDQPFDGISFSGSNYFKATPSGKIAPANGFTGTFKSGDSPQKTITVTGGIITNIV
jgi:hypothetical protein